jgi:hypothetical protein
VQETRSPSKTTPRARRWRKPERLGVQPEQEGPRSEVPQAREALPERLEPPGRQAPLLPELPEKAGRLLGKAGLQGQPVTAERQDPPLERGDRLEPLAREGRQGLPEELEEQAKQEPLELRARRLEPLVRLEPQG